MNSIHKTIIDGRRHAEPIQDSVTKRSIDCITERGLRDAVAVGRGYIGFQGTVFGFHSGMNRTNQTLSGINVGMERAFEKYQEMSNVLGQGFVQGANLPKGMPYNAEFISYLLEHNPGMAERVGQEVGLFLSQAYQEGVKKGDTDTLIFGISHAPKIEIAYGMLMGLPKKEIPELIANPLDGFKVEVDRHKKSGTIDRCLISYKGQTFEQLNSGIFKL
jgi:hypothetical protein